MLDEARECFNNLAAENASLRAALEVAREQIANLASEVGGNRFPARSRDSLRELALARIDTALNDNGWAE
ncbi:MAG TPA: hypothetical protein PKI99_09390 [Terrimesophilobacter sp.]|nr:hypothetical protein [Terrimesophilobacter sp.]